MAVFEVLVVGTLEYTVFRDLTLCILVDILSFIHPPWRLRQPGLSEFWQICKAAHYKIVLSLAMKVLIK